MKFRIILAVIMCQASTELVAEQDTEQTEQDSANPKIFVQPKITVVDSLNIPLPLKDKGEKINKWPGAASLSTSDHWHEQRAANIKDIVDFIPGVYAQQRNGAESTRLSIRGSGLGRQFQGGGLLLLQDGVPINTADGSFDFQSIDPWLTDYVSVFRGANGMALGGSTLGGVIELGSVLPNHQQASELRLSSGSYGTKRAKLTSTFDEINNVFRGQITHFNQYGFREQNQQNSNRVDLQYLIKNQLSLDHHFGLFHLNTEAQLPSSLSRALIEVDPSQSRGFNIFGNFHRDQTLTRMFYRLSNDALAATFFISRKKLANPVFTYINRETNDQGLNLNWETGHHQLQFTSIWGAQDELRRENEAGTPGAHRLSRDQDASTITATYFYKNPHNTLFERKIELNIGIQAIYAQRNIEETFPVRITSSRSYSQINPMIGISYHNGNNQTWFTNLSRSFEAPTFAELNNGNQPGINSPIKAQSAYSFEIGTRGFNEIFQWDANLYYSQIENEFIRFRFPEGQTRTTNANKSIHWGFEGFIKLSLSNSLFKQSDSLKLTNSFQVNQFKLDNDLNYGDNKIPGIPEYYFQTKLEYNHPSGWSLAPNFEWVPHGYYIDLANSVKTDQYFLTGFNLSIRQNQNIRWYLDAKNLSSKTYISTSLPIPDAQGLDGNYFYSGEGRNITLGFNWAF